MSTAKVTDTIFIPTLVEVPRISDAERAELLASLEQSRLDIAMGNYDVLGPDTLRREFEAIMHNDLITDEELDTLLGITQQPPR